MLRSSANSRCGYGLCRSGEAPRGGGEQLSKRGNERGQQLLDAGSCDSNGCGDATAGAGSSLFKQRLIVLFFRS